MNGSANGQVRDSDFELRSELSDRNIAEACIQEPSFGSGAEVLARRVTAAGAAPRCAAPSC